MTRTYLVTGGAGFIGSHLIDKLLEKGNVICLDNFDNFYPAAIKQSNIKAHLSHPNYSIYNVDIRSLDQLNLIFDAHEVTDIVHLAAKAGVRPSLEQPAQYTQTNINGTVHLLEMAKKYNIKNFVFASSSSVYGVRNQGPFCEDININAPISPYAATKASGEQICHTYSHLYGINIVCLRFFTVYGPRQRPDLAIHKFSRLMMEGQSIPVFGNGKSLRDYTYIDDIIQGVLAAIEYNKTPFEIINLGESQTVELNYLISLLEQKLKLKANIERQENQPGDVPVTYADISKAKRLLGYNPTTPIEQGLNHFSEWFNEYYATVKV